MNTSTQKRNNNDRSSAMYNFSDNSITAARIQNFTHDLAEEIRTGTTQISPENMAETDAIFTLDTILKFIKHRAVNSLPPQKNVSSNVYTVRLFSFRFWKMTATCTTLPALQRSWGGVNQR